MNEHEHVLYVSPSHIKQLFSEKYGDVSQIEVGASEEGGSSIRGRLGTVLAWLQDSVSGELGREEIHQINYDDETVRIKKAVHELLTDESTPRVSELQEAELNPAQLYRFDCEVIVDQAESKFDDESYVEVTGIEGNIKFSGLTALDNWGSRSDLLTAKKASDTYPFQGVVKPASKERDGIDREKWAVEYLFVCSPSVEDRKQWYDRQNLRDDLR